jgi:hypothetical protein
MRETPGLHFSPAGTDILPGNFEKVDMTADLLKRNPRPFWQSGEGIKKDSLIRNPPPFWSPLKAIEYSTPVLSERITTKVLQIPTEQPRTGSINSGICKNFVKKERIGDLDLRETIGLDVYEVPVEP